MAGLDKYSTPFNKAVTKKLDEAVASSMLKIFQSRNSSDEHIEEVDENEEPRDITPIEQSQDYSDSPWTDQRQVGPSLLPSASLWTVGRTALAFMTDRD